MNDLRDYGVEMLPNGLVRVFAYGPGTSGLLDPETREWHSVSLVPYGADPEQFLDGILAKVGRKR